MRGGAVPKKKPKRYYFHWEWEEEFFFTMSYSKCVCLICQSAIAIPKKGNVERHYRTVHKNYDTYYPPKSDLRKTKLKELKSKLPGQQSFLSQVTSEAKATTEAPLRVSHTVIKHKKIETGKEM